MCTKTKNKTVQNAQQLSSNICFYKYVLKFKTHSIKQVEVDQHYYDNLLNSCEVGITMNIFRALCKSDEYWIIWLVKSVGEIDF